MKKIILLTIGIIVLGNILTGCLDNEKEEIQKISPIADFTYTPLYPRVNQDITFDASPSNDPDGLISAYQWNFGDNSTHEGDLVTHVFTSEGTYTITLTITDNDNITNSTSKDLKVTKITEGTFYFSSTKLLSNIPHTGDEPFQIKPTRTDGKSFIFDDPLNIKPGEWSAILWLKSPLAVVKASLVARDKNGNEIDTMDFKIKLLRFNTERRIETAENFNGGEVDSIEVYFIGWSPSAWTLNTTMVSFLYGEEYPSSLTFY